MPVNEEYCLIPSSPDLRFEQALWENGVKTVAGVDEAGRGAIAGPVSAGAVVLPATPVIKYDLRGVRDSKEMTPIQREFWAVRIQKKSLAWGVGFSSPQEIDLLGIVPATRLAAQRALLSLNQSPEYILLDYFFLHDLPIPQSSLVKGDARSLSIAAASVLAKTARDAYMREVDIRYPGYGFFRHKGYATTIHREAINKLGPCPIHRLTFSPFRI